MSNALVLFSGGMDSAVCLAWAYENYDEVFTLGFDYGQRQRIELECRGPFLEKMRAIYGHRKVGADKVVNLHMLNQIVESALTRPIPIVEKGPKGLPSTFTPGRNILFFAIAGSIAAELNIPYIVGGMCQTDYGGYPDCRPDFMRAMETTLKLGMQHDVRIRTPLMQVDKAGTWLMAEEIGGRELVQLIIDQTHTCYNGDHHHKHEWGYGCGECPACRLRKDGYYIWQTKMSGLQP